jgi:hypothetical protein
LGKVIRGWRASNSEGEGGVEVDDRGGRVEVHGEKMRMEIREECSYTWGQHVSEKTLIAVGVITF